MAWMVLLDVLVVLAGTALLGYGAWRLVVRPGIRLGRALGEVGARATDALDALASATATATAMTTTTVDTRSTPSVGRAGRGPGPARS